MISKKAVIGTTLTWMVATFLIFFILIIFMLAVLGLSGSKDLSNVFSSSDVEINKDNVEISLSQTNNLINFAKENKQLIFDWADDEFILSYDEVLNGKTDEKIDLICNEIKKYRNPFGLDVNELYFKHSDSVSLGLKIYKEIFKLGDESFIAELDEDEIVCRVVAPNEVVVASDQQPRINSRIFIFSDKNKISLMNIKK